MWLSTNPFLDQESALLLSCAGTLKGYTFLNIKEMCAHRYVV